MYRNLLMYLKSPYYENKGEKNMADNEFVVNHID